MKVLINIALFLLVASSFSQSQLNGKIFLQSSGWKPVEGVFVLEEDANENVSEGDGSFSLLFNNKTKGQLAYPKIGKKGNNIAIDKKGNKWELVNERELEYVVIPESPNEENELKIIVAPKGQRDLAAQKYYKIIKTSSDIELARLKRKFNNLLNESQKSYDSIASLGSRISLLETKVDSIKLYKEALFLASINLDEKDEGLIEYLDCINKGGLIQDCKQLIDISKTTRKAEKLVDGIEGLINALETRSRASKSVYDFADALVCTDSIIYIHDRMGKNPITTIRYYIEAGGISKDLGEYKKALVYYLKGIEIVENNSKVNNKDASALFNNIGILYNRLGEHEKALLYYNKALENKFLKNLDENEFSTTYNNIGLVYSDLGDYDKALEYLNLSLQSKSKEQNFDERSVATSYDNLAIVHKLKGEYKFAEEYFLKSIAIRERVLGLDHPDLGITYNNYGLLLEDYGKFSEAIEYLEKSLKIRLKLFGSKHQSISTVYANLGIIYNGLSEYSKALEYHKKALEIKKQTFGNKHIEVAVIYQFIGGVYLGLADYKNATDYLIGAEEIFESSNTKEKNRIASLYEDLGLLFKKKGNYNKALSYCKKSIKIKKELYGNSHQSLAFSYRSAADLHQLFGNYKEAIDYILKAVKIQEELNVSEFDLAGTYVSAGGIYYLNDSFDTALEYLNKAKSIYQSDIDRKHPNLGSCLNNMGLIYNQKEEYQKAIELFKKAILIQAEFYGYEHPQMIVNHINLGISYQALQNYNSALECYDFALKKGLKILGADHPKLMSVYNNLGEYYEEIGDNENALDSYFKVIEIGKKSFDSSHPRLISAYYNLASLYEKLGENENSLKYYLLHIANKRKLYGTNDVKLSVSYYNLAVFMDEVINDQYKAFSYYLKSLEIDIKTLGVNHKEVLATYKDINNILAFVSKDKSRVNKFLESTEDDKNPLNIGDSEIAYGQAKIGDLCKMNKLYSKAVKYYKKAIKVYNRINSSLDTRKSYIAIDLAFCQFQLKEYGDVIKTYSIVLPKYLNEESLNILGLSNYYIKNYNKSIDFYQKAAMISEAYKRNQFYNNIGLAFVKNKQFKEAFDAFTKYEKLYPENGRSFRNWAVYHALEGNTEKAMKSLQEAINKGYKDLNWLKADVSIDILRNDSRFKKLLLSLK